MSSTSTPDSSPSSATVTIIRADDRSTWRDSALLSRQSFPATGNFDLEGNAFGLLMVHNDDIIAPGEGFDMHQHRDVELVSWVLDGRLRHRDDGGMSGSAAGAESELGPGMAQRVSAGRGIRHSEVNASGYLEGRSLRVIQAWLPPDRPDGEPSHDEVDLTAELAAGTLIPVASGTPGAAPLTIGTSGATLWVGRLPAGSVFDVPAGRFTHFFVASGSVVLDGTLLDDGDVARITTPSSTPAHTMSATADTDAEVLIWAMEREVATRPASA